MFRLKVRNALEKGFSKNDYRLYYSILRRSNEEIDEISRRLQIQCSGEAQ